jgi:hypothetical protein
MGNYDEKSNKIKGLNWGTRECVKKCVKFKNLKFDL